MRSPPSFYIVIWSSTFLPFRDISLVPLLCHALAQFFTYWNEARVNPQRTIRTKSEGTAKATIKRKTYKKTSGVPSMYGFGQYLPRPRIRPIPAPWSTRWRPLLDDPCDSLEGWTTSEGVDVHGGKFRFQGPSARVERAFSFDPILPVLLTAEVALSEPSTQLSLQFADETGTPVAGFAVQRSGENNVDLFSQESEGNTTAFDRTVPFRVWLMWDPVAQTCRGWIQDDVKGGPRYMGERATRGTPAKLQIKTGPSGSNDVLSHDALIDNIVVAPVWAAAIGDSRVAGHNGYDPWPGYPRGQNINYSWPHHLYKMTGAFVVNAGIGSTTSTQNLARIADVLAFKPQVLIIGTSNLRDETTEEFIINHQAMIDAALTANVGVIVTEYTPSKSPNVPRHQLFNAWLRAYCDQHGITMVPMWDELGGDTGLAPHFDEDGVHLSELGYRYIAHLIANHL